MPIKITRRPSNAKTRGPQVLVFDIETTPMLAWVWGCFKQYINPSQLIKASEVLCFAAKWLGEETVFFDGQQRDEDDKRICGVLWDLIDRADVVVAHNGVAFDEKTMNARWAHHGMPEPSPFKSVDTCLLARKRFNFPRTKLESVARYLEVGRKVEHEGFDLWTKCMDGDREAWARMREYNIQDVLLLEEVYMILRPWDKRHPNVGMMHCDGLVRCVCCGSAALTELAKPARTAVSEFASYRCEMCGKINRGRKRYKQSWGKANPVTNAQ